MTWQTVLAVLSTIASLFSGAAPGSPALPLPHLDPKPLRVLITNDDGWPAPGIKALRAALIRQGDTVIEVAPASDQSGTSAALTLTSPLTVTRPTGDPDIWSVNGRPADATLVGLRYILASHPPDLVVSGINSGNNVTESVFHSGTVGAAMTAVEFGVPAIAVSGPQAQGSDPSQYAAAADFTARLVARLSAETLRNRLLPPGTVLNVNYPQVGPGGRAKGVVAAPTADTPGLTITYTPGPSDTVVPHPVTPPPSGGLDDASQVARGNVALTDLAVDAQTPRPTVGVALLLALQMQP